MNPLKLMLSHKSVTFKRTRKENFKLIVNGKEFTKENEALRNMGLRLGFYDSNNVQ